METSNSKQPVGGLEVRPRLDLTRANRGRIEQALKESEGGRAERRGAAGHSGSSDRIEISAEARLLAAANTEEAGRATRELRTAELRAAYQDGSLNTSRRVESAAKSLMGDE